jgi:hypothetical protein
MFQMAGQIIGYGQAQDIVGDAVLNAWKYRSTWDGRASVKTWLIAITKNAALDNLRRGRSRPRRTGDSERELLQLNAVVDHHPNPEQQASRNQMRGFIAEAMVNLTNGMHSGMERWLDGETLQSTVRVQASRARLLVIPRVQQRMQIKPVNALSDSISRAV